MQTFRNAIWNTNSCEMNTYLESVMAILPGPESWKSSGPLAVLQQISQVFLSLLYQQKYVQIWVYFIAYMLATIMGQSTVFAYLTQMFWFCKAKCKPPLKLKDRTVPNSLPKYHWVQPLGAKLLKPLGHWVIRIVHLLSLIMAPTNTEKSMQSASKST